MPARRPMIALLLPLLCAAPSLSTAQEAAMAAPGRLPVIVGEPYRPPDQSAWLKNWYLRRFLSR